MKRHLTTLLLALAAVAAVVAYGLDRGSVTTDEAGKREGQLVTAWRRGDVGELTLTVGQSSFVLAKVDGEFMLRTSPNATDPELADPGAVERLLAAFEYARPLRKASEGADLGFAPPRAKVRVNMGRAAVSVEIGRDAPTPKDAVYARVDGGETVVVSKEFAETLSRPLDAYRDKRITPYLSPALDRLEITAVGATSPSLVLSRQGEAPFRLPRLGGARPRRERVDRLWIALVDLRAESFLDPTTAAASLATASDARAIRLTPKLKNQELAEIVVGGTCGEHGMIALRKTPKPVAACVAESSRAPLALSDQELLDRGVTTLHADEISILTFRDGGEPYDWARSDTKFVERVPRNHPLDDGENDRFKNWLDALLADETSALDATGKTPILTPITLIVRGGNREEQITFADGTMRRADDAVALRVGARLAGLLAARSVASAPIAPWTKRPDATDVLSATTRCDGRASRATRGERGYAASPATDGDGGSDAGASTVATRVGELANALAAIDRDPRAGWIATQDDGSFGLEAASTSGRACLLHVEWTGPSKREIDLVLGAPTRDGDRVFARFVGPAPRTPNGVFTAPATLRALAARGF